MCGIVGYFGQQQATPIIVDGLRRLEYRGYDSAGIAILNGGKIEIRRAKGKLAELETLLAQSPLSGVRGIGHTRWATHGRPSETNAHPHHFGEVAVVHNGIIENYLELKARLIAQGHEFSSETDTEIIAHLVDQHLHQCGDFETAVRHALSEVRGAYAVALICQSEPDKMIAAKLGSPLVVGQGQGEFFVASDIPAMLSHTREMIFLEEGELVVYHDGDLRFSTLAGTPVAKTAKTITWSPLMAEKGGYRHFMLKEIYEQPRAIADTVASRVRDGHSGVYLEGLQLDDEQLGQFDRLYIVACGTSWHAGLTGKFLIEKLARVPVEVDIASEFRYRDPLVTERTLTILISQSGETADTLAALREARGKGGKALAICNVVESSIARESDGVIYTHAGPEIGVASTKAFMNARDFLYLGRGNQYPIALEGALKLKEISYIHAEGYPAGEMKHGPIALIDEQLPVVFLCPHNAILEKVVSNLEEVRARDGRIIAVVTEGQEGLLGEVDALIAVPAIIDELAPVLMSIPMQLLAYHVAVFKGTDVDQPRNLAKSVTVE